MGTNGSKEAKKPKEKNPVDKKTTPLDKQKKENAKLLAQRMESVTSTDEPDSVAIEENAPVDEYDGLGDNIFPFENLVFEGGGAEGAGFCGALKVIEDLGFMQNIKRFAGTSAGAITAALVAVGYTSKEVDEFLSQDLNTILLDHKWGILSLLPSLRKDFGWNPGNRFSNWLGGVLAKIMGDPDVTFAQLYKKRGVELCVVVTNVSRMTEEYCHPKTTPHMPIRTAVRMSMSIPGWWLSMEPGDTFLERLKPLDKLPGLLARDGRFEGRNSKTLGFLVYEDLEEDLFRFSMEKRYGKQMGKIPKTSLSKRKLKKKALQSVAKKEHQKIMEAFTDFFEILRHHDLNRNGCISKSELEAAFTDISDGIKETLFGPDITADKAFELLDSSKDGEIQFQELMDFAQSNGVYLLERYLGYSRQEITDFQSFTHALQNALLVNGSRRYVEEKDIDRSVGINTGHVGVMDFGMEVADKDFTVEQGQRSMVVFLKHFVKTHDLPKRDKTETKQKENTTGKGEDKHEAGNEDSESNAHKPTTGASNDDKTPEVNNPSVKTETPEVRSTEESTEVVTKETEPESIQIVIQNDKENVSEEASTKGESET
ncbi:uncharacterized protein LOC110462082 isoform X2 [Mizuhopecten yessoensis]|uniref:uncharacterized protein LOC110462082 isoform X2 n=1 Tax=Mizuhopecten yessoensis TaxID=6573 RepID=UPI000B45CC6F|nr:uncharacterized protein LOC110462082 isoform X2 [Mizuhopecten yessoensis]